MKTIVLFDMDGTLAPSREVLDPSQMLKPLVSLSEYADIGIVTGSGLNYVNEQLACLINHPLLSNIHFLPCNGTQYYNSSMEKIHDVNMIDYLGEQEYENIVREVLTMQSEISWKFWIPLTGHFVDFRKSMLNWCPSGRDSGKKERDKFVELDSQWMIRETYLDRLKSKLPKNVTAALGGETSVDIYPTGWDKTYALKHFSGYRVFFVGDKCTGVGNDRTICEATGKNCFPTSGVSETVDIINQILIPLISQY